MEQNTKCATSWSRERGLINTLAGSARSFAVVRKMSTASAHSCMHGRVLMKQSTCRLSTKLASSIKPPTVCCASWANSSHEQKPRLDARGERHPCRCRGHVFAVLPGLLHAKTLASRWRSAARQSDTSPHRLQGTLTASQRCRLLACLASGTLTRWRAKQPETLYLVYAVGTPCSGHHPTAIQSMLTATSSPSTKV